MLTQEQISELKKQLSSQISHLPAEQKREAQEQIDSMSLEALEAMVEDQKARANIFRKIVGKEVETRVLDENSDAIAVIEIRPLSKGHVIVIPKKKITDAEDVTEGMKKLTKKVSDKVKSAMQAKNIKILTENKLGEIITDIIPIYDKEIDLNANREVAEKEELDEVFNKIKNFEIVEKKKEEIIKKEPEKKKILRLNRRIP